MLKENSEDYEAYQRLNITMPNEKVDEMDKERGNIPRSTYLSGLIGQRENPRGKTVVLPRYHRFGDPIGSSWLLVKMAELGLRITTENGVVVLNSEQLLRLTEKLLEWAKNPRMEIEDTYDWTLQDFEDLVDEVPKSVCSKYLRETVHFMEELRGCIINLRALGFDEYSMDDLESTYNTGVYLQGLFLEMLNEHERREERAANSPPNPKK